MIRILTTFLFLVFAAGTTAAQFMTPLQYWRPYDKTGLNIFETSKDSGEAFTGLGVRIGGGFTQGFQALSHSNEADTVFYGDSDVNMNGLFPIGAGFNNASANLFIDAQLASGVRLNLSVYLSSRHHAEAWVKGGYIQMVERGFLKSSFLDDVMEVLTIRIGHMEINYGDAHFRRTDGGLSMYNPFVENYLIDAFTTEIGGEVTFQSNGFLGMAALTNGEISGNVAPLPETAENTLTPAIILKAGYDKQLNEDLRVRVTGSMYSQSKSRRNTLFAGDRTGSNYFMVMEREFQSATSKSSSSAQFTSGRLNPNLSDHLTAFQFNGLVVFGGLEFFGTYEMGTGNSSELTDSNPDRSFSQLAVDLLYRFGSSNELYVAGRYNVATLEEGPKNSDGSYLETNVDRIAFAAGWYLLDFMLLKAEYVVQNYNDYPSTDYRHKGSFDGLVVEAAIGF